MFLELQKNPYRLFFPLALLCLLYGSWLWIRAGIMQVGDLPIEQHASLFLGGFLFFAILGFLLTAVPQFTKTSFLSKIELSSILALTLINVSAFLGNFMPVYWGSIFLGWIFFLSFFATRFSRRQENPPFSFVFVILGICFGLLGSLFLTLVSINYDQFESLEIWGKIFFYDAMVTSLVLGVGIRLVPGILGFQNIVKAQRQVYESEEAFFKTIPTPIYISLFGFLSSVVLEALEMPTIAYVIRALVISFVGFKYWAIIKPVPSKKWHGRMIKLACWFLILGSWSLVAFADYTIHMKHFIYVGTYVLLTLMISSRVVLAHAKESLEYEFKKLPYLLIGGLIALAACTRATAFLLPDSYNNHLGYAGLVLFSGALAWITFFIKRVFKKGSHV